CRPTGCAARARARRLPGPRRARPEPAGSPPPPARASRARSPRCAARGGCGPAAPPRRPAAPARGARRPAPAPPPPTGPRPAAAPRPRLPPVSEPPRNRDLLIGVELDAVAAVRLQVAEEAALGAAEREERHRRGHPDVDPQHARLDAIAVLARPL